MGRRWTKLGQENALFFLAVACLLILLEVGFKEQLFSLVYPGISYLTGFYEKQDNELCKLIVSFSNGYYGYRKEQEALSVSVENMAGVQGMLFYYEREEEEAGISGPGNEGLAEDESMDEIFLSQDLQQEIARENGAFYSAEFVKATQPSVVIDYEKLLDFEYLRKHFYTVDASTDIGPERLDARRMLSYDATVSTEGDGPQILIYHTHSQEGFADSIPGDEATSIIGVGDELARVLEEEYGFSVLHHKGVYDVESRDYAYSAAGPDIERILKENPSIQVVIDLHRDGVADSTRLVTTVGGRPTAQFMFFNGVSFLKSTGPVDYLENPYMEENLAFSFQMKLAADEYYPGFSRNIYLKGLRYNMHYCPKSLLIEVGAQTNTVEEVMNAVEPIAHILAMVMKGEKP
ncbi:MAG: stage II sporulation protein P [Lachnospiraceae bacterium]|nr:stage II sporulation protein P [Lachnospiraceae bacterium]